MSITVFKLPPFLLFIAFCRFYSWGVLWLGLLFTVLTGGMLIVFSSTLRLVLLGSSVANNSWFLLSAFSGFEAFSFFFVSYFFLLLAIFLLVGPLFSFSSSFLTKFSPLLIILLLSLSGLPPFPVFYAKILIMVGLFTAWVSPVILSVVVLFNVLVILGYLKYMFMLGVSQYSFPFQLIQ